MRCDTTGAIFALMLYAFIRPDKEGESTRAHHA